jgi:transposase-like protein
MKCPNCKSELRKIDVEIEGADSKAISYQCPRCDFVEFDQESATRVVKELKTKENPLKIKQKIIKLSQDRLGLYLNQNIVRSLKLKAGREILVSVPDRKHIVLNLED